MVFVCGVIKEDVLYAIDSHFYSTESGAKRRLKQLEGNDWIILYQDSWKPLKE